MSTELAKEVKAEIVLSEGQVALRNIDEAYRYALLAHKSGLAPKSFNSPEAILVAFMTGAELGLKPQASLQSICVVNGRTSLYGKGLPAVVLNKGVMEKFEERFEGEGDNLTAICTVARKGLKGERTSTFSIADAKKAGLMGKDLYQKYPKDMICYKARARAFTLFSDVLCGMPVYEDMYGRENTIEHEAVTATVITDDPLLKQIESQPVTVARSEPAQEPNAGRVQESLLANSEGTATSQTSVKEASVIPSVPPEKRVEVDVHATGAQPEPKKRGRPKKEAASGEASAGAAPKVTERPKNVANDPQQEKAEKSDELLDLPVIQPKSVVEQMDEMMVGINAMEMKDLRRIGNPLWKLLTKEQQRTVFKNLNYKSMDRIAELNTNELRAFLVEIRVVARGDGA